MWIRLVVSTTWKPTRSQTNVANTGSPVKRISLNKHYVALVIGYFGSKHSPLFYAFIYASVLMSRNIICVSAYLVIRGRLSLLATGRSPSSSGCF